MKGSMDWTELGHEWHGRVEIVPGIVGPGRIVAYYVRCGWTLRLDIRFSLGRYACHELTLLREAMKAVT